MSCRAASSRVCCWDQLPPDFTEDSMGLRFAGLSPCLFWFSFVVTIKMYSTY